MSEQMGLAAERQELRKIMLELVKEDVEKHCKHVNFNVNAKAPAR
jgi:hypothetical protein